MSTTQQSSTDDQMNFSDYAELLAPGGIGFGVITLTDVKDFAALAVALVSIVCTILVTVHKLKTK